MRKSMPLRVDAVVLREARKRAKAENRTLDEYVETVLRRDLARKPRKAKKPMIELRGPIPPKYPQGQARAPEGRDEEAACSPGEALSDHSRPRRHPAVTSPYRPGQFVRCRFPDSEQSNLPGSKLRIGYVQDVQRVGRDFFVAALYTTTARWPANTPLPLGVIPILRHQAAQLKQRQRRQVTIEVRGPGRRR